jgi:itaconate CoA-transferase
MYEMLCANHGRDGPHIMSKTLEGLLVVALEQAVAAPLCSRKLADQGARVIKLERPEGDFARDYDTLVNGGSTHFVWLNRGKESVVVDLTRPADRSLFERLIAKADIFLQNLKPGAIARLGYPISALREKNPRLICCSISGYGEDGPFAQRKAYDLLVQAESGLASITGGPDNPARVGVSAVDISTGMNAYEGILEALLRRARTGVGGEIQVSLFGSMAEWMSVPLLQSAGGKPPKRLGFSHPFIAPYGVFATSDGTPILISIQNDREWAIFASKILGRADLANDPKMATNVARIANRPELDDLVQRHFETQTVDALARALDRAEIAYGRVNDVHGLEQHPHLAMVTVKTSYGPAEMPIPAARHAGDRFEYGPVPELGAHSDAVRREFS